MMTQEVIRAGSHPSQIFVSPPNRELNPVPRTTLDSENSKNYAQLCAKQSWRADLRIPLAYPADPRYTGDAR